MAWLAVNKDGTEWIMPGKPVRGWCGHWEYSEKVYVESEQGYVSIEIELPKGSVYSKYSINSPFHSKNVMLLL